MKATVLGSRGFLGSYMTQLLRNEGHKVTEYDIANGQDLLDLELLHEKLKGQDWVFHCAGISGLDNTLKNEALSCNVNVNNIKEIFNIGDFYTAFNRSVRFIYFSSSSVYGRQESYSMKERFNPKPISFYGLQKLMAERYVLELDNSIILRIFNLWGKGQPESMLIGRFLKLKKEGKPLEIWGDGNNSRDFIHVKDIVRAGLKAAEMNVTETSQRVYNIGTGIETSINQIADMIGGKKRHIKDPREGVEERRKIADIRKARQYLKWEPTIFINKNNILKK